MPRKLRRYEGARLILKNQGIPEERIDYILEHVRLLAELSHQSDEYRRAWDDDSMRTRSTILTRKNQPQRLTSSTKRKSWKSKRRAAYPSLSTKTNKIN